MGHIETYLSSVARMMETNRTVGHTYSSLADYVYDQGSLMGGGEVPDDLLEFVASRLWHTPKMGECFYNAQALSLGNPRVQYVEGFAVGNGIIPCLHAWNLVDGAVVDVTWREDSMAPFDITKAVLGIIPKSWEYYGTVYPDDLFRSTLIDEGFARSLVDDFTGGYKLLSTRERKGPKPEPYLFPEMEITHVPPE